MIPNLGGRRFILVLGCGIACTVLVWFAKIDQFVFREVVISVVGAYILGNGFQKHAEIKAAAETKQTQIKAEGK